MDMVHLSTASRDTTARRAGQVPCVVYGNKTENLSFQCEVVALTKAYTKAGESSLVELDVDGKKLPVLFHDVKFDPVSDVTYTWPLAPLSDVRACAVRNLSRPPGSSGIGVCSAPSITV